MSVQTIKNWANAGQLQTVRLGGRVMIHRDAPLGYLDRIRRSRPAAQVAQPESEKSAARRTFVLAGLPSEKVERVRALTEWIEASQLLTLAVEDELARLEEEFARVSWKRLKQWVARRPSSVAYLHDAALWQASRAAMSPEQRARLQELHDLQQRRPLVDGERAEEQALLQLYRETLLVRALAAALLKQRGYEVSDPEQFAPLG